MPHGKDRLNTYLIDIDFSPNESLAGFIYYSVDISKENCINRLETIEKQFKHDLSDKSDEDTV